MAAKKQTNFEQRLHKAEQRAKRKLRRLEKKGIRTGAIMPEFKSLDELTTGQKRAYENQLEKFISRQTRYVAGYEGTPIHYGVVKQIRAAEKKLNEQRAAQWAAVSGKPMLTNPSSMTTDDYRNMTRIYDAGTGTLKPNPKSPLYFTEFKSRDISMLRGDKDAAEYIKALRHAGTKSYVKKKNNIMIDNMLKVMRDINEPELAARIKKLSMEQIYILAARSDFIESVFMNSGNDGVGVVSGIVQHLHDQLDALEAKEL